MKHHMFGKKALSALAAGSLALSMLAGCGGSAGSSSSSAADGSAPVSAPAGEKTVLRVCWWGNQTRNDNTMKALELYKAQHPEVDFEVEFSDWNGYWDKLATQAAGGNLPDIVQMAYTYLDQYVSNDLLVDLTPYMDSGAFDTADIADSVLDIGKVNGKVYAVCAGIQSKALLVNTDLMAQAGVTLPEQPTYDEFFAAAKTMYEKTGTQFVIPSNDEQSMLFLARSHGQTMFNEAGDGLGMPDDAVALEYYTMLKETLDAGTHVSPEIMAEASTSQESMFAAGKVWCEWTNSNMITNTINQCADDINYDILMYPTTKDAVQQPLFMTPSMYWSVAKDTKNADVAADVVNFLTNDLEANVQGLQGERGVPISSAVAEAIEPIVDDATKKINAYVGKVAEVATPMNLLFPAASAEVAKTISDLADMVRYGEISPEDAAAQFYEQATEILQKGAKSA